MSSFNMETVTATNAGTAYEITLPKGTKYFELWTNHASAIIRWGMNGANIDASLADPYMIIPNGEVYFLEHISPLTTEVTIYVASDTASTGINVLYTT